jgi:hypothetical protein
MAKIKGFFFASCSKHVFMDVSENRLSSYFLNVNVYLSVFILRVTLNGIQ